MRCVRYGVARVVLAVAVPLVLLTAAVPGAGALAPPRLEPPPGSAYPPVGPGTHFLDDAALLAGV